MFRVYKLQGPVARWADVADCFQIKPLLGVFDSADRCQALGLDRRGIRLFEGNCDVLNEVELALGVPPTMSEALGKELDEPRQTVVSCRGVGGRRSPLVHGHGGKG